jgi:hypothetical protein
MCGSKPPAPDPRAGQAALEQAELAKRMYDDYVAPGGERDLQRRVTNQALGIYDRADQRYQSVGIPMEDALISEVNEQDSPAYREAAVQRAMADGQMQFGQARQAGIRAMERRGVNPSSGAFQAMMADGGVQQATAMATAANKTRLAAQQVGLANKMQLYGGMKGIAGLGSSMQAAQGMTGAVSSSIANDATMQNSANYGMAAGIGGYNNYYGNIVKGYQAAAEGNPLNTMLGAAAGAATKYGLGVLMAG